MEGCVFAGLVQVLQDAVLHHLTNDWFWHLHSVGNISLHIALGCNSEFVVGAHVLAQQTTLC